MYSQPLFNYLFVVQTTELNLLNFCVIKHHVIILYFCKTIQKQWTPLHIASRNGHSSTVEILIKAGGDVKAVNQVRFFSMRMHLLPNFILFCINIRNKQLHYILLHKMVIVQQWKF